MVVLNLKFDLCRLLEEPRTFRELLGALDRVLGGSPPPKLGGSHGTTPCCVRRGVVLHVAIDSAPAGGEQLVLGGA